MYENLAAVGDRIRAFDFHQRTDCYIEGTVTAKGTHPHDGYDCYFVTVDADWWRGKPTDIRTGMSFTVPMSIGMGAEWEGRIIKV